MALTHPDLCHLEIVSTVADSEFPLVQSTLDRLILREILGYAKIVLQMALCRFIVLRTPTKANLPEELSHATSGPSVGYHL